MFIMWLPHGVINYNNNNNNNWQLKVRIFKNRKWRKAAILKTTTGIQNAVYYNYRYTKIQNKFMTQNQQQTVVIHT